MLHLCVAFVVSQPMHASYHSYFVSRKRFVLKLVNTFQRNLITINSNERIFIEQDSKTDCDSKKCQAMMITVNKSVKYNYILFVIKLTDNMMCDR